MYIASIPMYIVYIGVPSQISSQATHELNKHHHNTISNLSSKSSSDVTTTQFTADNKILKILVSVRTGHSERKRHPSHHQRQKEST